MFRHTTTGVSMLDNSQVQSSTVVHECWNSTVCIADWLKHGVVKLLAQHWNGTYGGVTGIV